MPINDAAQTILRLEDLAPVKVVFRVGPWVEVQTDDDHFFVARDLHTAARMAHEAKIGEDNVS